LEITLDAGTLLRCRKLLVATGVVDNILRVEDIRAFYGTSGFHCPYCNGWEMRDRGLAVYGRGPPKCRINRSPEDSEHRCHPVH
jgi:thioredoxin reductase